MYFATEGDWANTMKSFISTETFVAMLDKTLEQYLAMSKISRQQMDKFFRKGIVPNKKILPGWLNWLFHWKKK